MPQTVVVGASLAGLRSAEALRAEGYDGAITIVGAEAHLPYDRPPLSKQILTGKASLDDVALPREDIELEWRLGTTAVGLELADRRVLLEGGEELPFDNLVIATGATPRILPALPPGPGVHYLRTLDDAVALRQDLEASASLVVIGAGFIGLEVASSAQSIGVPVVVLEALPVPLERALGPEMGRAIMEWHRAKGIDLRTRVAVKGLLGPAGRRPEGVELADGTRLPADTVVVGVGVRPETDWLVGAGVDLQDGVLCDERLRVLAGGLPTEGIVAAGDVVRWDHPTYEGSVRVEHWTHAVESGKAAATTLVGGDRSPAFAPVPYFWSDQHGMKIQFVGQAGPDDEVAVLEGSFDEDRVLVAFGRAGRLVGALGLRRPRHVMDLQRRIAENAPFPPDSA